jgi:integrase
MIVPADLRKFVGKTELRYTLNTGYVGLAKSKARLLAGQIQEFFRRLREIVDLGELTDDQIVDLVNRFFRNFVNGLEKIRVEPGAFGKGDVFDKVNHINQSVCKGAKGALAECDYSFAWPFATAMLEKENLEIQKFTSTHNKICREILIALIKFGEIEDRRSNGDYSEDIKALFPLSSEKITELPSPKSLEEGSSITLEELIDDYKNRQVQSKKWSDNTIRNHGTKINTMLQVLGNRPVKEINVNDIRKLAKLLELLPPGFARIKKYKDLSKISPEDLKGKHDKTLDVSTRREYLNFAKSVFAYAEDNEYISKNPVVTGIIPPKKKNTRGKKHTFDDPADLEKIFNPSVYLNWSKDHGSRFWIPLLALYTGCRLEEMASLYCEDVFKHGNIWCIDINDNNDRKIKNQNAIRLVPLHPLLVKDLKFPQYIANVVAAGHKRVFPELRIVNYKYGHEFSKRFGYYLRKKVRITDTKKTFHSFRHTVSDYLYKKLVMESLVEELTGRAGKTETRKTYAKGYRAETLYEECILKLEYQVDLKSLKNSKFVPK